MTKVYSVYNNSAMVGEIEVKCSGCSQGCYGNVLCAREKYFHQYCFSCAVTGCNKDLRQVGYFVIDDKFYCKTDYHKLKGTKCAGCRRYVEGEVISAIGLLFHPKCFGCVICGKVFSEGSEIGYDGEDFFCDDCNNPPSLKDTAPPPKDIAPLSENIMPSSEDTTPPRPPPPKGTSDKVPSSDNTKEDIHSIGSAICAGCDRLINTSTALVALDKQWHMWCFTCHKCGKKLTEEYMGRDGVPYCEFHYFEEFGIACAGCGKYITGKVLQAGEKYYHPGCSRCAKCGKLFGEGEDMYLHGSEIWHPACTEDKSDSSGFETPSPILDDDSPLFPSNHKLNR